MSAQLVASKNPQRWRMLALTWSLYASFGITIGTIPPLVDSIREDLGMTYTQMGLVLGSWQLVYIGTASPIGALVDRLGIRRSLGVGLLLVLLSLVLRGLAVDFFTLLLAVALFGVGGPIISIGAPKVVSLWFDGRERGIAAGIYTTGPVAGTALALATAGTLVMPLAGTWRAVPMVYGLLVLIVLAAWWILALEAPGHHSQAVRQESSEPGPARQVLRDLLRLRNVQIILVLAPATFLLNHGLNNWLPTLLREEGMTVSQAGLWTATATAIGAGGLLIIPGLAQHGHRVPTLALLLIATSVSSAGLAIFSGLPMIAVLLLSTLVRTPLVPVLTLILMETPGVGARRMGLAAGLFFAAAEVGGFTGPLLLGFLRDSTGSLTIGVLLLAAVAAVVILTIPFIREGEVAQG